MKRWHVYAIPEGLGGKDAILIATCPREGDAHLIRALLNNRPGARLSYGVTTASPKKWCAKDD
jgi:hypothetical protein